MKLHRGDLRVVLPTLKANSFHACVTDPPYELGFMGKAWDGTGVAFEPETWRAVLRVLKPGAYLVAFGGTRTSHRLTCAIEDAGFEIRDSIAWLYGSGFPKHVSALKPAHEPIVLARKPAKYASVLNIDACRLSSVGNTTAVSRSAGGRRRDEYRTGTSAGKVESAVGRWPANVVLSEDAATQLDAQSGILKSGNNPSVRHAPKTRDIYGLGFSDQLCLPHRGTDSGGASRFFYCAKPSQQERNRGCDGLQLSTKRILNGGITSADHPRTASGGGDRHARNFHPTVKPVALMRWLVRLVTPEGGTVLDCFGGSGTTGMACKAEHRPCVLIEREAAYLPIIRARVKAAR